MRKFDKPNQLLDFRNQILNKSEFQLQPVNINDQKQWRIIDGALSHVSGGFFHILGLKDQFSSEEHLILYQPQSALTGMLVYRDKFGLKTVLQARVEPGNTGVVQYGPSIQSTAANYMKLHGGRDTDFIRLFNSHKKSSRLLCFSMQTDLGERYYQKSKTHNYVLVDECVETTPNTVWVNLLTLTQTMTEDYLHNTDLRSLLVMYDWDYLLTGKRKEIVPHGELLAYLFRQRWNHNRNYIMTPLEKLTKWRISNSGIESQCEHSLFVNMYHVKALTRETSEWFQPLMGSVGKGCVRLYRRMNGGQPEYLLSVLEEFGIDNMAIVGPTSLIYPGNNSQDQVVTQIGEVFRRFEHSEEGGRFWKHESVFEIVNVDQDIPVKSNQFWVTKDQLKQLFLSSNLIAIQLRVIASAIVDELNPISHGDA